MLDAPKNKMLLQQKTKYMSVKDYADLRGITVQAVHDAFKNGWKMKGVLDVIEAGRVRVLEVDLTVFS
jgi:predicted transcriptional regulator